MKECVYQYLKKLGITELELVYTEISDFGHLSSNSAFKLATKGGSPLGLANKFVEMIREKDRGVFFKDVQAVGLGFINFWLSDAALIEELKNLLKAKEKYGQGFLPRAERKKIQVEFISANPTGPLTMANGRGGFLGDALSNVLEWAGNKVEREYYVNDTGNQIIVLGKSILASLGLVSDEATFYKGDYIKKWATGHIAIAKKLAKNPNKNALQLGQLAAKDFLSAIKLMLEKKAKIHFDRFTSEERNIHKKSYIKNTLKIFKKTGTTYEKDGAVWLKTTDYGDDKDRVIITRDRFPTYFLADAGHYLETKERKFDKKVNIIRPDH